MVMFKKTEAPKSHTLCKFLIIMFLFGHASCQRWDELLLNYDKLIINDDEKQENRTSLFVYPF